MAAEPKDIENETRYIILLDSNTKDFTKCEELHTYLYATTQYGSRMDTDTYILVFARSESKENGHILLQTARARWKWKE